MVLQGERLMSACSTMLKSELTEPIRRSSVLQTASSVTRRCLFRITDLKIAITVRIDPDLLEEVRHRAERENRTLTNYIETALKERVDSGTKAKTGKGVSSPFISSEKGRH